mgnify:CR=1 FL=1
MAFTLLHNIKSKTAEENNINNFPGVDKDKDPCLTFDFIKNNLSRLHYYCVNPILEAFGPNNIKITSAYRCMELNYLFGGPSNSPHTRGCAIDLISTQYPSSILWNWCKQNLPNYNQLIWEFPERGNYRPNKNQFSWVHISYIHGFNNRRKTISSKREDLHEMYAGETTTRSGNYTHNIQIAEEKLL